MPAFEDSVVADAPVEEVWKIVYDPTRLPEWLAGVATIDPAGRDGRGDYTMFLDGYPDFPMPQEMRTSTSGRTVTISCLVSALVYEWRMAPVDPGDRTRVDVRVEIPEAEAHRLEDQRAALSASLRSLAALAATAAPRARG